MTTSCRTLVLAVLAVAASEATAADPPAARKQDDAKARSEWVYYSDSGQEGRFKRGNGALWVETATDGGENRFVESGRNARNSLSEPGRPQPV